MIIFYRSLFNTESSRCLSSIIIVKKEPFIANPNMYQPTNNNNRTPLSAYTQRNLNFPHNIQPIFTPNNQSHRIITYQANTHQHLYDGYGNNNRPLQTQSSIFPSQQMEVNRNRTLKLDSLARNVSIHQERGKYENIAIQAPRMSHNIQRTNQINAFEKGDDLNMKKPLYASGIFPHYDSKTNVQVKTIENTPTKTNLPIIQHQINQMQQSLNSIKIKYKNISEMLDHKQIKTDRIYSPNQQHFNNFGIASTSNFKPNITYNHHQLSLPLKTANSSKDSTEYSERPNSYNPFIKNQHNNVKITVVNNGSFPPNSWHQSMTPTQEKRLSSTAPDHANSYVTQIKATEGWAEFKKKKTFESTYHLTAKPNAEFFVKSFSIDNFELRDKIGKGSFGDVFIAREKVTGFVCVIKKLLIKKLKEMKLQEQLLRQIKIQSYLKHRHLANLYGFFNDESYIYMILQLMPDGSLLQTKKAKRITEVEASTYIKQICEGLKYMHTEQIIHRDIKPENIFVNDGYIKIGDFGCSIYTHSLRNTLIGSLAYISPEQLNQEFYDQKIDVWSVGVMTYEMLLGRSPYQQDIAKIAKREIAPQLSELNISAEVELSRQARDFLMNTLHLDSNQRISIAEALKHEFLRKHQKNEQRIILSSIQTI